MPARMMTWRWAMSALSLISSMVTWLQGTLTAGPVIPAMRKDQAASTGWRARPGSGSWW